jgi:hypothetical protein
MRNRFRVRFFSEVLLAALLTSLILTIGCGAKKGNLLPGAQDAGEDPLGVSTITKIQDLGSIRTRSSQTPQAVVFTQPLSGTSVQAVTGAIFYDLQTKLPPPYAPEERETISINYNDLNDGVNRAWNSPAFYSLSSYWPAYQFVPYFGESVVVSPDGKKIVMNPVSLSATGPVTVIKSDLYVSNIDGTNLVKIADGLPALPKNVSFEYDDMRRPDATKKMPLEAAWSKDQTKIAFTDINGIYIVDLNTKKLTKVATDRGQFAWSPDGMKVAFVTSKNIYITDANGVVLSKTPVAYASNKPVWSSNGQSLTFTAVLEGMSSSLASVASSQDAVEVCTMSVNGTDIKRLTTNAYPESGMQWSPDGTKISFDLLIFTDYETYIMDANGQNQIKLSRKCHYPSSSAWSPDGKQLAFFSQIHPGRPSLNLVNADGSNETVLPSYSSSDSPLPWYYTSGNTLGPTGGSTAEFPLSGSFQYQKLTEAGDSWLPFTRYKSLVGRTLGQRESDFGNTAAGYLRGEKDHKSRSLVLFDTSAGSHESVTVTPLSVPVTATSSTKTVDNLFFVVKGSGSINALQYMGFNNAERPIDIKSLSMPTGTAGVIVGFSAAGTVSATIPFQEGAPLPIASSGDLITISGKFPAVYNAKGENIAPTGATSPVLNKITARDSLGFALGGRDRARVSWH